MTGTAQRPLLFLDVDGPLIPFGGPPQEYPTFAAEPEALDPEAPGVGAIPGAGAGAGANPLLARLDPGHGPRLAALPCEVVWATTWMEDANDCLAPRLGLPRLEVVDWPEPSELDDRDARRGLHWKTRALVGRAAGRPFAWVDDELTDADRSWVAAHHPGPALLHRVDPRRGLTAADYEALDTWLRHPS
ncbi:HAD domain-containing protein [Kitasatospora sp. NPDC004240]